jgi:hypothetical protein
VLAGPATFGGACPGSAAVPGVAWDGSASRAGVRPPLTYAWSLSPGAPAGLVSAAVAATAANSPSLALTPAQAGAVPAGGPHVLTLTVTDVFGEAKSTGLATTRTADAVPLLTLPGGGAQAFKAAAPALRVPVSLDLGAACPGLGIEYAWAYAAATPHTFGALPLPTTKDLRVGGVVGGGAGGLAGVAALPEVGVGSTFALRLTAQYAGAASAAGLDLALTATPSPLSIIVAGPAGDVDPLYPLTFNAVAADPDDAVTPLTVRLPLSIAWSCAAQPPATGLDDALPPPQACELPAGALNGDGVGGLVLPAGALPADDGRVFTLTATATRGGARAPASASRSLRLRSAPAAGPRPAGEVVHLCGDGLSSCAPGYVAPPSSPLRLAFAPGDEASQADLAAARLSFSWFCAGSGCAALSAPGAASGVDGRSLVVWPTNDAGQNTVRRS